jgi:hypothetical protein
MEPNDNPSSYFNTSTNTELIRVYAKLVATKETLLQVMARNIELEKLIRIQEKENTILKETTQVLQQQNQIQNPISHHEQPNTKRTRIIQPETIQQPSFNVHVAGRLPTTAINQPFPMTRRPKPIPKEINTNVQPTTTRTSSSHYSPSPRRSTTSTSNNRKYYPRIATPEQQQENQQPYYHRYQPFHNNVPIIRFIPPPPPPPPSTSTPHFTSPTPQKIIINPSFQSPPPPITMPTATSYSSIQPPPPPPTTPRQLILKTPTKPSSSIRKIIYTPRGRRVFYS